jgi:anti-sigma-K factor RskA
VKNLKSYLESGILEQYVLGDLSIEERLEVEKNAVKYPEIKAELIEIESALLNYAISNAIKPSESLRNKVLNSLEKAEADVRPLTYCITKIRAIL